MGKMHPRVMYLHGAGNSFGTNPKKARRLQDIGCRVVVPLLPCDDFGAAVDVAQDVVDTLHTF